jgi:tRNA(Ile)-lysidine synthase
VADRFDSPEALAGHVARQLAPAVRAGERLCVGFSGGLDSTVLLDVLAGLRDRLGFALEAMHVHHGLSPNADAWASSCEAFAQGLGVPIRIERVRFDHGDPAGLEAAARRARRAALSGSGADAIALAHHRDDQAETVLLQALRGTGLKGLAGMGPVHEALGVRWVRPLLEVPRAALEAHAGARSLVWVEDESNDSVDFDRNFLRREGLPLLASRFPQAGSSLARLARHAASAGRLLEALARQDAGAALEAARLPAAPLRALPPGRAANVLRHWIEANGGAMPSEARLAEMLRQLLGARGDADVRLAHEGYLLARHGDALAIEPAHPVTPDWEVAWRGEAVLSLGDRLGEVRFERRAGVGIAASRVESGRWRFASRRGGERIRLAAGRPTRTLKNLLQEGDVPAWQRDRLPLLFEDGRLVWVPGIGISADYRAGPGEPGFDPRWTPAAPPETRPRP